jgi:hypothetical protein
MTDTTSGALPGLRAGSFTLRPTPHAGSGIGLSTKSVLGMTAVGELRDSRSGRCPAGARRLPPSLIVLPWHHGRGRIRMPDKEIS